MAETDSSEASAIAYKVQGNTSYQRGDYRHAIYLFSKGLELTPGPDVEHILFSNRSACYCLLEDFPRALSDAEKVVQMKPDWPKGYTRQGAALQNLKRYDEASVAYRRALELDPENDIAKRGLEDIAVAVSQQSKRFVPELSQNTKTLLETAVKDLEQLRDVRWHFEILKDRIWLADPPLTPFRPRSMFVIDIDRGQLLSMTAHPVRDSISLDQLVEFVVNTFLNSGIYPGVIEFSDFLLMSVLAPALADFNIQFICDQLSEDKQKFFAEKIEEFEAKEREQWQNNNKFAGVLRQRQQKGMLAVPGVTAEFLKHLLSAAAAFYRSKTYLYFCKPIGITTEDGSTKVAMVSRNALGQYSLAMSTVDASKDPMDCGTQSYIFADASTIPFDDADLIERYGWDIAEDKYPLPTIHQVGGELQHPSAEDLHWYELAFWVSTLFVEETFAKPTYLPPPSVCCQCTVYTHKGKRQVLVTVPPVENPPAPDFYLESHPPAPPKERLSYMPFPVAVSKAAVPSPVAKKTALKRPSVEAKTPKSAEARLAEAKAARSHQAQAPPQSKDPSHGTPSPALAQAVAPAAPPQPSESPAAKETSVRPNASDDRSSTAAPAAPKAPMGSKAEPEMKHGVQVSYKSEVEAYTGLLAPQEDLLVLRRKTTEQEKTVKQLTSQLTDAREQLRMQQQLSQSQKAHIDQLQAHLKDVERLNDKLRHDLLQASKKDQLYSKELLLAFASQSQDLVKALSLLESDTGKAKEVLEELCRKTPPEAITPPSTKFSKSPRALVKSTPSPGLSLSPMQRTLAARVPESPPAWHKNRAPSVDRSTPPGQPKRKGNAAGSSKSSIATEDRPLRPIPSAAFMAGPWIGRLKEIAALPQDLSEEEYLAPSNSIF